MVVAEMVHVDDVNGVRAWLDPECPGVDWKVKSGTLLTGGSS
jgi:hypothetical protein